MAQNADTLQRKTKLSPESLRQLGLRIAAQREALGWSQRELGRRAGLLSSRLSRLERGRSVARLGELIELRNLLAIDLDELVCGRPPDAGGSRLERLARNLAQVGASAEIEVVERMIEGLLHRGDKKDSEE